MLPVRLVYRAKQIGEARRLIDAVNLLQARSEHIDVGLGEQADSNYSFALHGGGILSAQRSRRSCALMG